MTPCGEVVFRQLPHVADSFNVLSSYCVARGLGASLLYKCLHHAVAPYDSTAFLSVLVPYGRPSWIPVSC